MASVGVVRGSGGRARTRQWDACLVRRCRGRKTAGGWCAHSGEAANEEGRLAVHGVVEGGGRPVDADLRRHNRNTDCQSVADWPHNQRESSLLLFTELSSDSSQQNREVQIDKRNVAQQLRGRFRALRRSYPRISSAVASIFFTAGRSWVALSIPIACASATRKNNIAFHSSPAQLAAARHSNRRREEEATKRQRAWEPWPGKRNATSDCGTSVSIVACARKDECAARSELWRTGAATGTCGEYSGIRCYTPAGRRRRPQRGARGGRLSP